MKVEEATFIRRRTLPPGENVGVSQKNETKKTLDLHRVANAQILSVGQAMPCPRKRGLHKKVSHEIPIFSERGSHKKRAFHVVIEAMEDMEILIFLENAAHTKSVCFMW